MVGGNVHPGSTVDSPDCTGPSKAWLLPEDDPHNTKFTEISVSDNRRMLLNTRGKIVLMLSHLDLDFWDLSWSGRLTSLNETG